MVKLLAKLISIYWISITSTQLIKCCSLTAPVFTLLQLKTVFTQKLGYKQSRHVCKIRSLKVVVYITANLMVRRARGVWCSANRFVVKLSVSLSGYLESPITHKTRSHKDATRRLNFLSEIRLCWPLTAALHRLHHHRATAKSIPGKEWINNTRDRPTRVRRVRERESVYFALSRDLCVLSG